MYKFIKVNAIILATDCAEKKKVNYTSMIEAIVLHLALRMNILISSSKPLCLTF